MAVVWVRETWHGRKGCEEGHLVFSTYKSDLFVVTYSRTFLVYTDSATDDAVVVLNATGIPRAFEAYPGVDDAVCRKVEAVQRQDHPQFWDVSADYSTEMSALEKNPLNRPPEVKWGTRRVPHVFDSYYDWVTPPTQLGIEFDPEYQRVPVLNAAGDMFDPPPEKDKLITMLSVTRNEGAFDPNLPYYFVDSVNEDMWLGAAAGTWKCAGISASSADENGLLYWKVTYEFEFDPDNWDLKILNAGFNQLDGSNNRVLIHDPVSGRPYSNPQLLDASGHVLAHGAEPVYLTFHVYREMPFDILNITVDPSAANIVQG